METDYTYDALDNLLNVKQYGGAWNSGGGLQRYFMYDSLSHLLTNCNPEAIAITYSCSASGPWSNTYTYDANGNVSSKMDARGIATNMAYDGLNRLTSKSYVGGDTATPAATFNYDESSVTVGSSHNGVSNGIGRMTSWYVSSPAPGLAMKSFSYDEMGRPISSYECWGSSECGATGGILNHWRNYDLGGNVTKMNNSANRTYLYTYDGAGRVNSLANQYGSNSPQTMSASVTYAPSGQPVARNGIEMWVYDNRMRLTSHAQYHGPAIYSDSITQYQSNGNIALAAETAQGTSLSWSWQYSYDTLNRLLTAVSTQLGEGCIYAYDNFGNRSSEGASGTGSCVSPTQYLFSGNFKFLRLGF